MDSWRWTSCCRRIGRPRATAGGGAFPRVEGSPTAANGTTQAFEFVVTTASNPAWVQYRATSKAGVALGTHVVLTQANPTYKAVGMVYTDHLSANNIFSYAGCTYSSSQSNTTTFQDSGAPIDGAIGPQPSGTVGGSLFAKGDVGKYAEFSGCKWNDMASRAH